MLRVVAEENEFSVEICLHGFVEVEVIAGDVGEYPAVELASQGPALIETVGTHFHRNRFHALVRHSGK